ncbi:hypothetical protein PQX77_009684 [Marasmius sp. AFHP31]|nr:hypothetical protein PQX77_009684 [Marasmius sp. AFHP31]
MLCRLTWEMTTISTRLNGIPGFPGVSGLSEETQSAELAGAVRRAIAFGEDTVRYLHHVKEASREISGGIGKNTVEKEINKAALGSRSRHFLDIVD